MKTSEYFERRAEQVADKAFVSAEDFIKRLATFYSDAADAMQKEVESFFAKYATDNNISFADARKELTKGELEEFKRQIDRLRKGAAGNTDKRWVEFLDYIASRARITRLETLTIQMRQQVELLAGIQQLELTDYMGEEYSEAYNRTVYNVQVGAEVGAVFVQLDTKAVAKAVGTKWDQSNYSERIWLNRDKLVSELEQIIPNAIARGESTQKTTSLLRRRMDVARSNAERVVRTETAHIIQEATFDGYKAAGFIQQYKILATLDKRTSEICQAMDGKVFKLSEKQVGVTAPPFHPNCRTTTVVYFDDAITTERIARDSEGKNVKLAGDITYEEWAKKFGVKTKAKFTITPSDDRGLKGGD